MVKKNLIYKLLGICIILVIWEIAASSIGFLPSLGRIASLLFSQIVRGESEFDFLSNFSITLQRVLIATIGALVVGSSIGTLMGVKKKTETYLAVPVMASLFIPSLIYAFLFVLWFGTTEYLVPVLVAFGIVLPKVIVNFWDRSKDIDKDLIEMAKAYGASPLSVWKNIYFPALMPSLFSSLRIGFSLSWKVILIGELFGAKKGLGHVLNYYFHWNMPDHVIVWAIPFMVFTFLLMRGIKILKGHWFKWREQP